MEVYVQQHTWGWLIITYLFLGGLGGAVGAIGTFVDQFIEENRALGVFSALSGFVILAIGSFLLLLDLLQPMKAIYFFANPSSWIFWGIIFISGFMGAGILYSILRFTSSKSATKFFAIVTMALGFAVTIYTGFLLSFTPAIPFWHNSGLPILFVLSAFSTGCAYLMVYFWMKNEKTHLISSLEKLDAALIAGEMVVIFAYFLTYVCCPKGGQKAVQYLFGKWGFVYGFLIAGLIIPLIMELFSLLKKDDSPASALVPIASILILIGGFLLRKYIVSAGFFVYPW